MKLWSGGVGLPSRVMFPFLPRRVRCWNYLAYKTTSKQAKPIVFYRATAVEAVESPLICAS